MIRLCAFLALAATVAWPSGVLAAEEEPCCPMPEEEVAAAPAPPPAPAGPTFKVNGYDRVRVMSWLNYDLDAAAVQDNSVFFTDIRSYLTLEAAMDQAKVVTSLDLAGSDFDQGAIMGFDNSARQRLFDVKVRHLYLDYTFPGLGLAATLGRQPARVGYGIVSSINRDSFKLVQQLPDLGTLSKSNVTGVWVRGAKGVTQQASHLPAPSGINVDPGRSGTIVTNDPSGAWHELNTLLLAYNTVPAPNSRLQAFVAQQLDFSEPGAYPMKRYVDLNGEYRLGALTLGGEAVYLGGASPAAAGNRTPLNSFALLATGKYELGALEVGLMAGRGGGDNDAGDGQNTSFQSLFIDESSFQINNLFGNDMWGFNGTDAAIARGSGLANVTFVQPNFTYHFRPDLKAFGSYTKHLTTAPQRAGSGILGTGATTATALATNIGDEVDLGLSYTLGMATFYGIGSTFVPGDVFAKSGLGNAAHKIELGTEVKF